MPKLTSLNRCPACKSRGQPVERITLLSLLLRAARRRMQRRGEYMFCPKPGCDVVYFELNDGARSIFGKPELSVRVGVKESEDPIPVCYCWGYTKKEIIEDFLQHGRSLIKDQINSNCASAPCPCKLKNPSGRGCSRTLSPIVEELERKVLGRN